MLYSIEVIFDHDGSCHSTLVLFAHSMLCPRGYLRIPWSIFNPPHCFEPSCCTYAMLSHFSCVRLCVTPQMAAHQAPPSLGFSRQEHWSGLPFSFSNAWKWKVKMKSLSHVWLLATPRTAAYQAPRSMGFSRQEYWSGVPLPSPNLTYRWNLKKPNPQKQRSGL